MSAACGGVIGAFAFGAAAMANRFLYKTQDDDDMMEEEVELFRDLTYLKERTEIWAHVRALGRQSMLHLPSSTLIRQVLESTEKWAHMAAFLRVESNVPNANQFWAQYTLVHDKWLELFRAMPSMVVKTLGDQVVLRDRAMQTSWQIVDTFLRKESESLRNQAWRQAAVMNNVMPQGEPPIPRGPQIPPPGTQAYREWLRRSHSHTA